MKKFIVSTACCGDASSYTAHADCEADIAYHYLLKAYYNTYYCKGWPDEKTQDTALRAYLAKSNIRTEYEAKHMRARKKESILKTLCDDEIMELFRYMYTGGYGNQSGIPGKEWETVEIKEQQENDYKVFPSRPRK